MINILIQDLIVKLNKIINQMISLNMQISDIIYCVWFLSLNFVFNNADKGSCRHQC